MSFKEATKDPLTTDYETWNSSCRE